MFFYKVLNSDGSLYFSTNKGKWSLPKGNQPGKWMTVSGPLSYCRNGFHMIQKDQLLNWVGPSGWLAEIDDNEDKMEVMDITVARKARLVKKIEGWTDQNLRLFASRCAEKFLHIYEERYPADRSLRKVIEVARDVATGKTAKSELEHYKTVAMAGADRAIEENNSIPAWIAMTCADAVENSAITAAINASIHSNWSLKNNPNWQLDEFFNRVELEK